MKQVIFSADDFGLSLGVNEAVEEAHKKGVLATAGLMVAAPFAEDAVRRAKTMPALRVGLHVVLVEGESVLPYAEIPHLVGKDSFFSSKQVQLSFRYFFSRTARKELEKEIRAQFEAFARTGLEPDHVNAHKHMQLHPLIGSLLLKIGREFGFKTLRVPYEPPAVMKLCGEAVTFSDQLLALWTKFLRFQVKKAGFSSFDQVFGLKQSGRMSAENLLKLAEYLPDGVTEIYSHPAVVQEERLVKFMPGYQPQAEFRALIDPSVKEAFTKIGALPPC